jgi:hypothetical protein
MKSSLIKSLIAVVLVAVIILFLYKYTDHRPADKDVTNEDLFKELISPVIDANASANAEALRTLRSGIHAQFEAYRSRVPTFTADITSIGNKSKITWEAAKQMASEDKKKVERHVSDKFEMHVVSGKQMEKDLEGLLHAFRRDIEANRNRMLVDINEAVRSETGFESDLLIPEEFTKRIEQQIRNQSKQAGKNAVVLSGMTFLVSLAAEEAVRNLVVYALTRVGTTLAASMATTAAVSGGATAAGGAGGGTAGSLGGPAGAVIGIAAGLTVGIIVDIVMTDRMEKKLNDECTSFLTKAEMELTTKPGGLVSQLEQALENMDQVTSSSIKQQIKALP